jgi:hypothetical protein
VFLGAVGAGPGAGPVDVVVHHQRAAGGQCQADLDQAVRVQKDRMDLKSRIDALLLLQDRMEQLDRYGKEGASPTWACTRARPSARSCCASTTTACSR